ncbi:hypothetical protein ABFU50_12975 [Xanthomonas campestris pv. campestris]|uniref:hypothetical protein n=1 Tax=Xanthomonas campestris TaxID=339 RepID=UPI00389119E4
MADKEKENTSKAPLLKKTDLQHEYSWKALEGDNPHVVGAPDSTLLSRSEGYEVLDFINRFAEQHNLKQKNSGKETEWLIKIKLPSNVRSHANVRSWLEKNWKTFNDEWDNKLKRGDIVG